MTYPFQTLTMKNQNPGPATLENDRTDRLSGRLEKLEIQLGRLADLLTEQAAARQRRRRRITLRSLLGSFLVFALLFAWFGRVHHQSRLQAAAVDRLTDQGVFVMYSPRESALVSLLPGDPVNPPRFLGKAFGVDFFRAVTNVSTQQTSTVAKDKTEILEALASLSQLQRLRLTTMPLTTADLSKLRGLRELRSLDVARTGLDSGAMPWLPETQIGWLNASHTCLGDRAVYDLSRCRGLQKLILERTCVTDQGLKYLHSMSQLRYLNLKRCPVSQAAVKQLSDTIPGCVIDWEPLQFLPDGNVDVLAAKRGRVQYGTPRQEDPRESHRVDAPMDQMPQVVAPNNSWRSPYLMLDVF